MRDATHHIAQAESRLGPIGPRVADLGLAQLAPMLFANVPLDLSAPTSGEPVPAVANHGRWIVRCPDCHGAQLTHPADPRFLCNDCGNVGNARAFRPVAWPKDHEKISALLDERAEEALRSWVPGETVADLRAENAILAAAPALRDQSWAHPQWFDPEAPHTHRYPKKPTDGFFTCRDCELQIDEATRRADLEAGL